MIKRLVRTTPADRNHGKYISDGLRALLYEGVCSQVMDTFAGGAFLIVFALLLGASNTVVGLLAAISPLTQLIQLPAIYLVDRMASRKTIVVFSSFFSRIFLLVIAVIPWLVMNEHRLLVLFVCLFLYFGLASISACAFNPWLRDFVPEKIMGRYFGKRLAASTAAGVLVAVLAGAGLEFGVSYSASQLVSFSVLFFLGGISGLAGVYFLTRIPEPARRAHRPQKVFETLAQPVRDLNFRRLLVFLGIWFFAINLTGPFYAVYIIKQLGLSMALVVGLSALSQIMSVLSFQIWGRAADNFSNKSVLFLSGHLYIISVLLWPFLALSQSHLVIISLLVIIHVLTGISSAGVNLCAGNIALKAAPKRKSTAFLALKTLIHGVAATAAPILGGIAADWLTGLKVLLWHGSPHHTAPLSALQGSGLKGLDILFFLTAILGLYAMRRLRVVHEEGEIGAWVILSHLATKIRSAARRIYDVAALQLSYVFRHYRENGSGSREGVGRE